ncbi:MAG: chorismate mutase [Eubacteriales bacterium]|nr:chorismate mutase [Eubacteriales bacterium]MDN5363128.1 chorismate mutase [Eubacteriales bacterium]
MVEGGGKRYYLVREDILPEAIRKTALVKELLARGEARSVHEAVEMVGLSRSAFYKYRDGVQPFYEGSGRQILTLSLLLEDRAGVLSTVLNTIAAEEGNILTINQNIPLAGVASVSLAVDTSRLMVPPEKLIASLQLIRGVRKVEVVGRTG